ncbi:MAG: hypothetical protein Kow0077_25760 [Anaerolineae bacterium]
MLRSNPLRTLIHSVQGMSLRRRIILAILPVLVIGFAALTVVGLRQVEAAETRVVAARQEQVARLAASRITVYMRSLPQFALSLSSSNALDSLTNISARGERPDLAVPIIENAELTGARDQALAALTNEVYELALRNEAIETVSLFGSSGAEVLRIYRSDPDGIVRIAQPEELRSVANQAFFAGLDALPPFEVKFSPLTLNAAGQPVLTISTPIYRGDDQVGGLAITVRAESFLQFVEPVRDVHEGDIALSEHLLLVDSAGRYLRDTRITDASGAAHLLNAEAALPTREPPLQTLLEDHFAGALVDDNRYVATSVQFNPFGRPVDGTPWTIIVLQDEGTALQNVSRFATLFIVIALGVMGAIAFVVWRFSDLLVRPLDRAASVAQQIAAGDLETRIAVDREDEVGRLAAAINTMTDQLVQNLAETRERFGQRTRDLEVAAEIASLAVGMNDVRLLLDRAVNLIRDQFGFYHVQVFMVDARRKNANLVASTGEAGQKMLSLNWSLGVGSDSVIGTVTAQGKAVIALDTADAAVPHRPNPHLPQTRSEMALPMTYGGEVIGALDIQSVLANAFTEDDVRIFQVLANQLAIAVSNARQLDETRRQMARVEELNRRLTRQAWDEFLEQEPELERFMLRQDQAASPRPGAVVAPIEVMGEVIGMLETTPEDDQPLTEDEIALVRAVAERVSLAVENARLVTQTQRSLYETERLYNASQRLRDATSLQGALETLTGLLLDYEPVDLSVEMLENDAPYHLLNWNAADGASYERSPLALPEGLSAQEMFARPPLFVERADQASNDDPLLAGYAARTGARAALSIPIELRNQAVGRLTMAFSQPRRFRESDRDYLTAIVNQFAIVADNWALLQQTQESLDETSLLYETSSVLVDVKSVDGVLDTLVRYATGDDLGMAQLYLLRNNRTWHDPDAMVEVAASRTSGMLPDLSGMAFSADQLPGWQALATPTLLAVDDIQESDALSPEARLGFEALGLRSVTIMPLEINDLPAGAILFGYEQVHRHTERELRIFQNLRELATIALQNIQLLAQTQNRALQLQTSAEVSRAVTSILDVNELLPRIVNLIRDSFRYDHVQIFLLDDARENAVLRASTGEVGQTLLRMNWSLAVGSNSVIGQVTKKAEAIIALDTADAKVVHRPNPYLPDTRSEMAIPLISRGQVVGALDVQSRQPSAFSDEDLQVLTSLADQIGIALDNARLFQESQNYTLALSEQVMALQRLVEASQSFTAMHDADQILQEAALAIVELLGVEHAGIVLAYEHNPDLGVLRAEYPPSGLVGAEVTIAGPWMEREYKPTLTPVVISDIPHSPLVDDLTRQALMSAGVKQLVLMPFLISGDRVMGSIGLDMYEEEREFTLEDLTLLQLFATQLASAYQNAQSFARTQRQAEDMRFLFNVTTAAAEATDLATSMETVVLQLQDVLPADAIGVYVRSEQGDHLDCVVSHVNTPELHIMDRIPVSGWITQQALAERKPFMLPDITALPEDAHGIVTSSLRSLIATPLFSGNEVIGLITIFKREQNAYDESYLRLLQALSGSISAVVQNIRLLEEVRAANERLRELDKVKSQFLANMSHELRTPLNSIIGFSRVILKGIDGPLTEMQKQDLETIHSSGQHLLNLINDILDQAKIEADKLSLNVDWFDINAVIDVARSMSIGLLKDKPVRLNVEIEPNLPKVWGDEIRTRQVLLNLLSNAAKFTHEGSITVAAFTVQGDDGPYVQISVSDTGIGIPEDKLDSVFVAFEQVDGSLTRTSGGTGLGLPISKSLIELMGGRLWVESTLNVGSTFSFVIPSFEKAVAQVEDEDQGEDPLASEAKVPYEELPPQDRRVVLVIDSEVGMHQVYRRHLNKVGYTVEATANVGQARDMVFVTNPDIILMDVRSSDQQGWPLLEWLCTAEETAHIPVIVCSLDPEQNRALELGAVAYLAKPFQPGDLVTLVQEVERDHVRDRVLVIDDQPESVRLIVETLKEAPRLHVQTATSGQQGLEMIEKKRPDVVLLDLNMPEVDGFDVLERLRSNPRTRDIPVVIVTAEDDLVNVRRGELGGLDIFSKNADDPAQLLTGVHRVLAHNGEVNHEQSNGDGTA